MQGAPQPTVVNSTMYGNKLLLLGSNKLPDFCKDLDHSIGTRLESRHFGAFRRMVLEMARNAGAAFVVVDLGPHIDTLHKMIISSCDALVPTRCPSGSNGATRTAPGCRSQGTSWLPPSPASSPSL